LPVATNVKVSVAGNFTKLENLLTGEILTGQTQKPSWRRRQESDVAMASFNVPLPPHSYVVFESEQ
jgi:hypothetical protein